MCLPQKITQHKININFIAKKSLDQLKLGGCVVWWIRYPNKVGITGAHQHYIQPVKQHMDWRISQENRGWGLNAMTYFAAKK